MHKPSYMIEGYFEILTIGGLVVIASKLRLCRSRLTLVSCYSSVSQRQRKRKRKRRSYFTYAASGGVNTNSHVVYVEQTKAALRNNNACDCSDTASVRSSRFQRFSKHAQLLVSAQHRSLFSPCSWILKYAESYCDVVIPCDTYS